MPAISPVRRFSTSSGSSYLPPSSSSTTTTFGDHKTSLLSNSTHGYRSSSLSGRTPSNYSSYTPTASSIYRSSAYSTLLTGNNSYNNRYNDTSSTRFGVSNNNLINSKYLRSTSDSRDTAFYSSNERKSRISSLLNKDNNKIISSTTTIKPSTTTSTINKTNTLLLSTKPPRCGSSSSSTLNSSFNSCNNNTAQLIKRRGSNTNEQNNSVNNNLLKKSSSSDQVIATSKSDPLKSSSIHSSSSLALQVATSGLDLYEKYSPSNYIPKCELSRSRSLSEATTSTTATTATITKTSNLNNIINNSNNNNVTKSKRNSLYDLNNNSNESNDSNDKLELSTTQLANKKHLANGDSFGGENITSSVRSTNLTPSSATTTPKHTINLISSSKIRSAIAAADQKPSQQRNNITKFHSRYSDTNFLKIECELARQQVVKTEIEKLEQKLENNNNSNNNNGTIINVTSNGNNNENNIINTQKTFHHKTSEKIATTTKLLFQKQNNNNMNCFQNSSNSFDDIKYIDSDGGDSERQHQQSTSSIKSTFFGKTKLIGAPRESSNSINQQKQKSSTLPITTKRTNSVNNPSQTQSVFSQITSYSNKYNTHNDFKSSTSSLSSAASNVRTNSNSISRSNFITHSTSKLSLKKYTVSNNNASKISANLVNNSDSIIASKCNLPNSNSKTATTSTASPSIRTSIASQTAAAALTTSSLINTKYGNRSSSSSPQIHRRSINDNCAQSPKSIFLNGGKILNNSVNDLSNTSSTTANQTPASDISVNLNDSISLRKQHSNNLDTCDNDENVRNTSIRSTVPSSPSRYDRYDRERRSSILSSRINDNDSDSCDKEGIEGLCGLRNIGNTCFMNSVIQCLSHTRELTKFLKTQTSARSSTKDQQILYEFAKLIREMWTPTVNSVTPSELKSAFSSKHRMYSGYNQQDAQEFLRFFLDSLHSALNSGVKGDALKIEESLSDNKKADLTWEWYTRLENSVVRDLFVGQLKSTLKCTSCGNTSVTFDPFWDLSVPLPSSSRCKLDSCLDLFIREEVLDGDEMPTCSKCKIRRKCTKSFTIQRFPKYLVIHLKRFSETRWSKLSNTVEFPTGEGELNMGPYAANATNVYYSLYAISNHMGSTAGGHYVALCKHPVTKKWHEFNDNIVSDDLPESSLVSSSAYLLFYEKA